MSTAELDYVNNYWGEKHHGHHVMYENVRRAEESIVEFGAFLKDRVAFEDETQKLLAKNAHRIGGFIAHGSLLSPAWAVAKATLALMAEIHGTFHKSLQEFTRELSHYQDEYGKARKRAKDQDVIDTVNLMQTTTTCLQKAKETYVSRFNDFNKLKKDGAATSKELAKSESKLLRAKEEYRQYVEKYEQIRVQYERKMEVACNSFQGLDTEHYTTMRGFLLRFSSQQFDTLSALLRVCARLREQTEMMDAHTFIDDIVRKTATGKERPVPAVFEDFDGLLVADVENDSGRSAPSSCSSSQIVKTEQPVLPLTAHDLLTLHELPHQNAEPFDQVSGLPLRPSSPSPSEQSVGIPLPAQSLPPPPLSTSFGGTAGKKLSMWLPKRKKTTSQSSIPDEDEQAGHGGGGFLKFRKNSKKKSQYDLSRPEHDTADDAQSTTSSCRSEDKQVNGGGQHEPAVDAEGFTVRPASTRKDSEAPQWSSCSSSEDEDENELQKSKIRALTIKPAAAGAVSKNASVDELRDAIGHITLGRSSTFDRDPWASTATAKAPFSQSLGPGMMKPLRAAYTGDEHLRSKFNEADFAKSNAPLNFSASIGAGPFAGMARARPRSNTPTTAALGASFQRKESVGSQEWGSHLGLDGPCLSSSLSTSTINLLQSNVSDHQIPVAMALNEYCHVWFKDSSCTKRVVRVFGTVMISFAASSLPLLTNAEATLEPLKFRLTDTQKIKAVLLNKELLIASGTSPVPLSEQSQSFCFDKAALAKFLLAQRASKPADTAFFNAEVLRYELSEDISVEPPLNFVAFWKTEPDTTDILIDYRLNPECANRSALLNVVFSTKIVGGGSNVISDPPGAWQEDSSTLSWSLTEISPAGQQSGVLKARVRLQPGTGPSTAAPTNVTFQCSDSSLSNANVVLETADIYRLSMVRRKLFAGKYFCDAEVRK